MLYSGLFFITISIIATGLIAYIEDNIKMIIVAMVLRAMQGCFKNFTSVARYTLIAILHPNEKIKYLQISESVFAFGISFGPVIGSVLYSLFGYFTMFLILGLVLILLIIILKLFMPSNINDIDNTERLNDDNVQSDVASEQKINYCSLISDHVIQLASEALLLAG